MCLLRKKARLTCDIGILKYYLQRTENKGQVLKGMVVI